MAKISKELQWRMEGMLHARNVVRESGIEALEKEIKARNFLKADLWAKKGEVEALHKTVSENVYISMLTNILFAK